MWRDDVCRLLIHGYNSDDDIIIIAGVRSLRSPPPQVSHLYMTPLHRIMVRIVSISRIQYVLCLTSGIYISYFVCYKDSMS